MVDIGIAELLRESVLVKRDSRPVGGSGGKKR